MIFFDEGIKVDAMSRKDKCPKFRKAVRWTPHTRNSPKAFEPWNHSDAVEAWDYVKEVR